MRENHGKETRDLGLRVRRLRREGGMTLEGLSVAAGVSRAMISKVERGEKSPTVAVLRGLAAGLGVSIGNLVGEEPEARVVLTRRGDQKLISEAGGDHVRRVLSEAGGIRFFRGELSGGLAATVSSVESPGEKAGEHRCIVVESGGLSVRIGGGTYEMEAGDSLVYDPAQPCELRCAGGSEEAVYYDVEV